MIKNCNLLTSTDATIGLGVVELEGDFKKLTIAFSKLKAIVDALHKLKFVNEDKIKIIWNENSPIIIGELKDNKAVGIILAPRID